jgi:hypothetical protein
LPWPRGHAGGTIVRRPPAECELARGIFNYHACPAEGNVLDFVHRMETRDGTAVSFRQAGLLLAEICGLELTGTPAPKGARKPQDGPSPHGLHEEPRKRAPGRSRRPGEGHR